MTIQSTSDSRLQFSRKVFLSKNDVIQEAEMSRNIHSGFSLAKMIVTKAEEIEAKRQKENLVAEDEPQTFELVKESLEDTLDFLMDITPHPIFFLNSAGKVVACNARFVKLIGKGKIDIIGTAFCDLLPAPQFSQKDDALSTITPGEVCRFEIEFQDHLQKSKTLLVTCIGLGNTSDETIVGSITDVTDIIQHGKTAVINLEESVERLQTELDSKHQKLTSLAELLVHSKNTKSNFIEAVSKLHPYLTNEGKSKFYSLVKQIHWELNDEKELCVEKDFDQLHTKFYLLLEKNCPTITKNEKRLCAYLKSNHGASDIAKITNKSINSINVAFARLRSKLQLPNSKELRSFLLELSSQNESATI